MSDEDTPTRPESRPWQINIDMAELLAHRLQQREIICASSLPVLDTRRATMLRHLRMVAEYYAQAFRRWVDESVPVDRRAREQREFAALMPVINAVLDP